MLKMIKKIVLSFFLIYSFNLISVSFNLIIPINIFTIGLITFFDVPAIFVLGMLKFLYF